MIAITDQFLDSMRQVGDERPDQVIATFFADSEAGTVNDLMRTLVTNEFPEPATLPPIVRDYLQSTDVLPTWADPDRIQLGERLFWRYGPKLILILNSYSLPWDYLGRKGVHVLTLTTRLLTNPTRRVTEVAQFLVDVMQPGGITTGGGRGRRSIQKVRLMHAAVRRLASQSPAWNREWDLPINQEDLAGTLMSFSWIVLDGLQKLGAEVSHDECEAYLHCWRVIGYLLGIREELLPLNIAEARTLADNILRRQFGPTEEGQALAKALIEMMANTLPGDVFRHVVPVFMRFFLGKQGADWLGVADCRLADVLSGPLRSLVGGVDSSVNESKILSTLADRVGHLLIESIVYVERGGNRPSFSIPTELRQTWGVNWLS